MSRRRDTQLKGSSPILGALLLGGCMLPEVGFDDAVQIDASALNVGIHDRTPRDEEHSPWSEQTLPVSTEAGAEPDARAALPSAPQAEDLGPRDAGADCVQLASTHRPGSDAGAGPSAPGQERNDLDASETATSPAPVQPACATGPAQTTLPEDEAPDLTEAPAETEPPAEPSEAPSSTGEADNEQDEQAHQDESSSPADTATAEPTTTAPVATPTQTQSPPPPATTTAPPATTTAPPATTAAPPTTTPPPATTTPPNTPPTATTPPNTPDECEGDNECDSGSCRNDKCKPVTCSDRGDEPDDECDAPDTGDECSFDEDCPSLLCVLGLCGEVAL